MSAPPGNALVAQLPRFSREMGAILNCHFCPTPKLPTLFTSLGGFGAAMEIFRAEKIATVEDRSGKTCRFCGEKLTLVRVMVNSDTGAVIHMFECPCGERIWID
jgi:hypothetical protein